MPREASDNPFAATILVVDDDVSARNLLITYLGHHHGYTMLEAENGQIALDLIAADPPDLVVLDIMMPGLSGLEVLQTVRGRYQPTELPVVLLTALGDTGDVTRGLELGASDYLVKPVDLAVLTARIRGHLRNKRLHDQALAGLEQLRELDVLKDRFMQIAAHDLKSPLGTIGMGLQILGDAVADRDEAGQEIERVLQMMEFAVATMRSIIDDYLDLQTIKAGRLELDLQSIQLNHQLESVLDQFRPYADSKSIALEADLDPALPRISGDPDRLAQVINNLISNAIKFTPRGGQVVARTRGNGGSLRLEVSDSGPGIRPEEVPLLFQEFTRLSNRPTGGEKSSGVGLAIARYLIEAHQGRIGVHTQPGQGSTFWVELPVA